MNVGRCDPKQPNRNYLFSIHACSHAIHAWHVHQAILGMIGVACIEHTQQFIQKLSVIISLTNVLNSLNGYAIEREHFVCSPHGTGTTCVNFSLLTPFAHSSYSFHLSRSTTFLGCLLNIGVEWIWAQNSVSALEICIAYAIHTENHTYFLYSLV